MTLSQSYGCLEGSSQQDDIQTSRHFAHQPIAKPSTLRKYPQKMQKGQTFTRGLSTH